MWSKQCLWALFTASSLLGLARVFRLSMLKSLLKSRKSSGVLGYEHRLGMLYDSGLSVLVLLTNCREGVLPL